MYRKSLFKTTCIIVIFVLISFVINALVVDELIHNIIFRTIINIIVGWVSGTIGAILALKDIGVNVTFKDVINFHKGFFKRRH